ncbi:MAG: GNAT family N-acetyltransferase [Sphingobacteriales bacterium]|nr:GNAT family N-acetyltransferase [Sphingobacteriales bacterium]
MLINGFVSGCSLNIAKAERVKCKEIDLVVAERLEAVKEQWDSLLGQRQLLLCGTYLEAIERAAAEDMEFRYVIFYKNGKIAGAAYFQILMLRNSLRTDEQDCVWKRRMKQYFNANAGRFLIAGNALTTGEHGFYFGEQLLEQQGYEALGKAIRHIQRQEAQRQQPFSGILVKDFYAHSQENARVLKRFQLKEVETDPSMVLDIRWKRFEDYLGAMSSKYRVRAKKLLKKGATLEIRDLDADFLQAQAQAIYDLYNSVSQKAEFNLATVPPHYFYTLKRAMGSVFGVRGYFLDNQLVGFITMFFTDTILETHYIGFEERMNQSHALYQNILYDVVRVAIERQVQHIGFGRTALEPKSSVGAHGIAMNNYAWYVNPLIYHFCPPYLSVLKTTIG